MKLYEMLDGTKTYDTFESASIDFADAVSEVKELEKSRDTYKEESERLTEENLKLKERNLELLSMISIDNGEEKEEPIVEEKLTIEDLYKEV